MEHQSRRSRYNFAAFETVINAFDVFIARYIFKCEIGLRPVDEKPVYFKEDLLYLVTQPYYLPKLEFDRHSGEFLIPPKYDNLFSLRRTAVQEALDQFQREQGPYEALMHVNSDGRTPSSKGGTYATASLGSMKKAFVSLNDSEMFGKFISDHPVLAQRRICFLDIGAGFNRPAYIAAVSLGWISHGLECNLSRARIACQFYSNYLSQTTYKNVNVYLHQVEEEIPLNISGFSIIMLWDRVRYFFIHTSQTENDTLTWNSSAKAINPQVFESCLKNVYRSMNHDVIMIVSYYKYSNDKRKEKISQYFDIVEEGPKYQIHFKGSNKVDSLLCLRVRRRLDCPCYVQPAPTNRLINFVKELCGDASDWHNVLQGKLETIENLEKRGRSKKSRMSY